MKRRILLMMMFVASVGTFAQNSDVLLTQQWFSRINRNPAATGNSDDFDFFLLARNQWTGTDDAPQTYLLNAHSYYDKIHSGIGISFYYDKTGISDHQINAKLTYSYQIDLKEDMLLSFGVSAGIINKAIDYSEHDWEDRGDYFEGIEKESKTAPDFDFGIEYSIPKFLFGASITHLGKTVKNDKFSDLRATQHHYLYARGNFPLSEKWDITPSVVYQNVGKINTLSIGTNFFFKKQFWFGLDYRTPSPKDIFHDFDYSTLTAMLGVEFNKWRIGLAYDLPLGRLRNISKVGTAELMLSLRIPRSKVPEERFIP